MRLAASLALGAGLVVGAVAPAHAADDDLVTLGATTSATLPAVEVASARFPVVPTDPKAVLTPEVVSITSDGFEVVAPSAVTARYDDSTPALVLEVRTDELPDVATYAVTVRLTTAGGQRQAVTVSLVRPAATLTVPATTTWTRTTPLCLGDACLGDIPWLGTPPDQPPLVVSTGSDSRVLDLRARPAQGDAPRLEIGAPKQGTLPLGPDEDVTLSYSAGPASPGSAERTATLVSDQVGTATPVAVTVVTRRPNTLIGLVLLGGVLLGWLVRRALPLSARRAERLSARSTLQDWLTDTDAAYDDRAVRAAVQKARNDLGDRTDAESIASVEKTVRDELTLFGERLAARAKEADALAIAARPRAGLEQLDGQLSAVRASVESARAAIAGLRADDADREIARATDALRRLVQGAGGASKASLTELARALAGKTEGAEGALAQLVAAQLQAPAAQAPDSDVEQINVYLDGLSVASRLATLDDAVRAVAAEAAAAYRGLGQRTPMIAAPAINEAAHALDDAVTQGTAASTAPILRQLHEAYAAVATQLGNGIPERVMRGDVAALISEHLAGRADTEDEVPVPPEPPEKTPVTTVEPPVLTPRVLSLPAASFLSRFLAVALHLFVAVVIVLVTGYALFLPDWLGTNAQVGQVAVWAFAVDTSIAGLALLAGQRAGIGAATAGTGGATAQVPALPGSTTTTTVTTQDPRLPADADDGDADAPAGGQPAPPAGGGAVVPAPAPGGPDQPAVPGAPVVAPPPNVEDEQRDEAAAHAEKDVVEAEAAKNEVVAAGATPEEHVVEGEAAAQPDAAAGDADEAGDRGALVADPAAGNGHPQGGAAQEAGPQQRA